jgi:hypothetical protein
MNVYGELSNAQLENLTSDPAASTVTPGRMWMRTDLSLPKINLGANVDTLLLALATQSFSNKTTATALTFAQIATPSAPASGFDNLYFKSDDNLYRQTHAGVESRVFPALVAPTIQKFLTTGTTTGYLFTISTSTTCAAGDTYTNNGNTYTVLAALSAQSGAVLYTSQASAPTSSGTLTRATGSGTSSISFSAALALATYTPTSASVLYVRVRMSGGGGGGGAGAGASGNAGAAGTASYFGPLLLTCLGGSGGSTATQTPTAGGAASSFGSGPIGIAIAGGAGNGGGATTVTGTNSPGGLGGVNPFGGSSGGGASTSIAAAANTGAGGIGGQWGGGAGNYGGNGGGAGAFVDALITTMQATFVYAVATGGAGGAANSSWTAGANGGSGIIEVTEYYQ